MPAGRPRKRSAPALDPGIPPRSKNHRTQTNPWEAARDESFEVEKILAERRSKGQVQYEVHWKGYTVDETTWEPFENLVDATEEVAAFRKKRKDEDAAAFAAAKRLKDERYHPPLCRVLIVECVGEQHKELRISS